MWKFMKCNKCNREYIWFKCYNCKDEEEVKEVKVIIKKVEEKKIIVKEKLLIKKEEKDISKIWDKLYNTYNIYNTYNTYNWLQIYSSSYLNNKMNKDLNSIKNERICIKVEWWYILHSDIIEQFKINNNIK